MNRSVKLLKIVAFSLCPTNNIFYNAYFRIRRLSSNQQPKSHDYQFFFVLQFCSVIDLLSMLSIFSYSLWLSCLSIFLGRINIASFPPRFQWRSQHSVEHFERLQNPLIPAAPFHQLVNSNDPVMIQVD